MVGLSLTPWSSHARHIASRSAAKPVRPGVVVRLAGAVSGCGTVFHGGRRPAAVHRPPQGNHQVEGGRAAAAREYAGGAAAATTTTAAMTTTGGTTTTVTAAGTAAGGVTTTTRGATSCRTAAAHPDARHHRPDRIAVPARRWILAASPPRWPTPTCPMMSPGQRMELPRRPRPDRNGKLLGTIAIVIATISAILGCLMNLGSRTGGSVEASVGSRSCGSRGQVPQARRPVPGRRYADLFDGRPGRLADIAVAVLQQPGQLPAWPVRASAPNSPRREGRPLAHVSRLVLEGRTQQPAGRPSPPGRSRPAPAPRCRAGPHPPSGPRAAPPTA